MQQKQGLVRLANDVIVTIIKMRGELVEGEVRRWLEKKNSQKKKGLYVEETVGESTGPRLERERE